MIRKLVITFADLKIAKSISFHGILGHHRQIFRHHLHRVSVCLDFAIQQSLLEVFQNIFSD